MEKTIFSAVKIEQHFIFQDWVFRKINKDTGIAFAFAASNYFDEQAAVTTLGDNDLDLLIVD